MGFVTIAVNERVREALNDAKAEHNRDSLSYASSGAMIMHLIDHWRKTRESAQAPETIARDAVDDAMRELYGAHGPDDDVNADAVRRILAELFRRGYDARGTA